MFQVLGINDEQKTCDCCGRDNLKRTVILRDCATGEVTRRGVVCAARATGRPVLAEAERAETDYNFVVVTTANVLLTRFGKRSRAEQIAALARWNAPECWHVVHVAQAAGARPFVNDAVSVATVPA